MTEPRIAVVVRQAGSTNGLLPVLRELSARGVPLLLLAGDAGAGPLISAGLPVLAYGDFDDVRDALAAFAPTFLLTGTSLVAEDDARFWQWAGGHGVPSAAFVDSWTHLEARFRVGGTAFSVVPDTIGVPDERCAEALRIAGAPSARVRILGQPAFDESISIARSTERRERARRLRAELLERHGSSVLVAFISEPTFADPTLSAPYSAREALAYLAEALRLSGLEREALIAIRLHPREREDAAISSLLDLPRDGAVRCEIVDGDRHDLVLAADHVVGMTSFLLRESAIMGRHVVSIQPNASGLDEVLADVPGVSRCGDVAGLREALTASRVDDAPAGFEPATARWLELVLGRDR